MKLSLEFKGETWFPTDAITSESESGVVIEEEKDELSDKVDEDRELERRDIMCNVERTLADVPTNKESREVMGHLYRFADCMNFTRSVYSFKIPTLPASDYQILPAS
jgi:hypothetical protein